MVIAQGADGTKMTFTAKQSFMFDVCETKAIPVALGDRLRILSGVKKDKNGNEIINGELFIPVFKDSKGVMYDKDGRALTTANFTYAYTDTVRRVQGSTGQKNIFGLDKSSIKAATPEVIAVATTRGREELEIIVESVADLAQIELKSSQRKGVGEMLSDVPTDEELRIAKLQEKIRKEMRFRERCAEELKQKKKVKQKKQIDQSIKIEPIKIDQSIKIDLDPIKWRIDDEDIGIAI
jgi:hypothetical protein